MPEIRFGIDVGGTFTDVVAHDPRTGALQSLKVPTNARDQSISVLDGIEHVLRPGQAIGGVVHGTTTITNAILEGKLDGAGHCPDDASGPVVLVTTAGFRDVLEIG